MMHVNNHIHYRHGVLHDDIKYPNKIVREITKNVLYINMDNINECLNLPFFNSSEMVRHNLKHKTHINSFIKRGFEAGNLDWD